MVTMIPGVNHIAATKSEILESLKKVMDPEIPVLSVVDLGIIEDVSLDGDIVKVKMIPTFTACPAIHLIREQIKKQVEHLGFANVQVEVDKNIAWNSDRISDDGRRKLNEFGLAGPAKHKGTFGLDAIEEAKCPHCGSSNTTMNSLFGSTLCRSIHYCYDCKQSFERFKPV